MTKEKETFRMFLGSFIEDKDFFESLHLYQLEMKNHTQYKIRWVKDPNIHMTWKFLGEMTESRIQRTIKLISTSIINFKPMTLIFDQLEIWPKPISPKQLVLIGKDLNNNIEENYKHLEYALKEAGFKPEKRSFKPHITLGRFKTKGKLEEPITLQPEPDLKINAFGVSEILLTKSILLPDGPQYTTIKHFQL